MANYRPMKLVVGYIPGVDRASDSARELSFKYRTAFVLETFHPDKVDMYFEVKLYCALVQAVGGIVGADILRAELSSGKRVDLATAIECMAQLEQLPEHEREPFPRVACLREGRIVAIIESEPWARVGGPDPYHDSYTVAVFSASDLSNELLTLTGKVSAEHGVDLAEIIRGNDQESEGGTVPTVRRWFDFSRKRSG